MQYLLHLGVHRTGTTALQKLLHSRQELLNANGIGFWGPNDLRGWGLFNLLQGMVDGHTPVEEIAGATQVLTDCAVESGSMQRFIISDENLMGSLPTNYADASLYSDAEERLKALASLLPASPDLVLVTIRNPVPYWQSAFAHLSTRGRADRFDAERLASAGKSSWLAALQSIRNAFPQSRLRILGYDDTIVRRVLDDLVGPVLAARLPEPSRVFSLALPNWTRDILAASPKGPERAALSLQLRAERDQPDRVFPAEMAATLAAVYAQDWAALQAGAIAGASLDPQLGASPR